MPAIASVRRLGCELACVLILKTIRRLRRLQEQPAPLINQNLRNLRMDKATPPGSLENLFAVRLRRGFGLAFHPHIIRNVIAVAFHERLEVVSAADNFAAAARATVADKVVHLLVVE